MNPLAINAIQARTALNQWLELLTSLSRHQDKQPAFRAATSLLHLQVADDGYLFVQWLDDLEPDAQALTLASVAQKPFVRESYPEYRFRDAEPAGFHDRECNGFAYAVENNCLTWSLNLTHQWAKPAYQLVQLTLDDAMQVEENPVNVWHLPVTGFCATHQPFIEGLLSDEEESIKQKCCSGNDILADWVNWFPKLLLTKSAEHGLQNLPTAMVRPIVDRLLRLQRFFQAWDGLPMDYSILGFHTNRESTSRAQSLDVLTITLPNGSTQLMDWHMRYPLGKKGSGRLFFMPEPVARACYIGYIGSKDGVT